LQTKLREFLTTYLATPADAEDMDEDQRADLANAEPVYITLLKQIAETEDYTLDVDCNHIHEFNP